MSKTKWTPGPWQVVEHNNSKTGIYAGEIYIATCEAIEVSMEEMDANANLIAAAPDLYEALQAAIDANSYSSEGWVKFAIDTLAQARGEQK